MSVELSPQEKIAIAEQHMKNIMFSQYNANLSLIETNAESTPNQSNIEQINAQLENLNLQVAAIQKEIDAQKALIQVTDPASN